MCRDLVIFIQHAHLTLYHSFLAQTRCMSSGFTHAVMHIVVINDRHKCGGMLMTVLMIMVVIMGVVMIM